MISSLTQHSVIKHYHSWYNNMVKNGVNQGQKKSYHCVVVQNEIQVKTIVT